eukprot:7445276-Pyramimonas_sp.AAC.2
MSIDLWPWLDAETERISRRRGRTSPSLTSTSTQMGGGQVGRPRPPVRTDPRLYQMGGGFLTPWSFNASGCEDRGSIRQGSFESVEELPSEGHAPLRTGGRRLLREYPKPLPFGSHCLDSRITEGIWGRIPRRC